VIDVPLQALGVAVVPLNRTVLPPWVVPKFVPVIVTLVPTGPLVGLRLLIACAEDDTDDTANRTATPTHRQHAACTVAVFDTAWPADSRDEKTNTRFKI
jgi:hypothetical protein